MDHIENISDELFAAFLEGNVDLTEMLLYGSFVGKISTAMIKFKGTTSEHLPQMFDSIVFSYELDSDGFVTTIKEDGEPIYYIEYAE